ncbi:uncharacterized protein [Aegilops tauschii subsp. strangulata]|uniref:uncharacterized protein n=1 Tax=Aegilops tauschii subsp. strangulata TaxID=200361 RepID=UPI003CC8CDA8
MIFTLTMDVLNSILTQAAATGVLQRLMARHAVASTSLYADDVVVFCHAHPDDLMAIREILRVFGDASGMRTNFAKCAALPIRCSVEQQVQAMQILDCRVAQFPTTYLGIPLAIRKPTAAALLPLIDKLSRKLSTWRGSMVSRGERLAFVRHVLSAMPMHILMAFALNKNILAQVNRIIHGFCWAGRKDAHGGQCMVNWARVCHPLSLEGLGVSDLHHAGIALRMRWLWLQRTDPRWPWALLHLPLDPDASAMFRVSTT